MTISCVWSIIFIRHFIKFYILFTILFFAHLLFLSFDLFFFLFILHIPEPSYSSLLSFYTPFILSSIHHLFIFLPPLSIFRFPPLPYPPVPSASLPLFHSPPFLFHVCTYTGQYSCTGPLLQHSPPPSYCWRRVRIAGAYTVCVCWRPPPRDVY